jgi:NAD-dependent histone deacetylase SIR2
MGQESSQIDPNAPTRTLSARTLEGVAEYVKDGRPKRIVVMTGAGISTSAGIPDFRSPDTGLYANLARLDLPYAEAVFDISYFREHPEPFYVLAKELYPGKFFPTISHSFVALLDQKSMLLKLFTQNIDCLERRAGVPGEKIIEAHGSFATQRCIDCKTEYPDDLMMEAVESGDVPHCIVPQCNGLVKPDIVFFGEQLPESFHQNKSVPAVADLVIVMGTSLSVQPFASLPMLAREDTPRVLINKEEVGDLGSRADDVLVLGDCDAGVRKLADALGWRDELEELWAEVNGKAKEGEGEENALPQTKDEELELEIQKLTGEVDAALKISKDHTEWVAKGLEKSANKGLPSPSTFEAATPGMNGSDKLTTLDTASSSSTSGIPTQSEIGWKEPPSTPAVAEEIPIATEEAGVEVLSKIPITDQTVLDTTLPDKTPHLEDETKTENLVPEI